MFSLFDGDIDSNFFPSCMLIQLFIFFFGLSLLLNIILSSLLFFFLFFLKKFL